jgi:hypothetical protein
MDADDETAVEPIPDIVQRLSFYSREPAPASPNGPEETAVDDLAAPSATADPD